MANDKIIKVDINKPATASVKFEELEAVEERPEDESDFVKTNTCGQIKSDQG